MKRILIILCLSIGLSSYAQEKMVIKAVKYSYLEWDKTEHRTIRTPWLATNYNILLIEGTLYIQDKNKTTVRLGKTIKESSDEKEKKTSWYGVDKKGYDCTVELSIKKGTHYGALSIDYVDLHSYLWIIDYNNN